MLRILVLGTMLTMVGCDEKSQKSIKEVTGQKEKQSAVDTSKKRKVIIYE